MPDRTPQTDTLQILTCARCKYDLSGLPDDGVCPECANPIGDSIRRRKRPWPKWLRLLRTAYFTAFATLIAAPYALPPIARALGLPVVWGWAGVFGEVMAVCILLTAPLGLVLAVALPSRSSWLTYVVAGTLVVLGLWLSALLSYS